MHFGISRPIGGAVPNLAWALRLWCWWSIPSLVSIDQVLAEIQPLNQFGSTLLFTNIITFFSLVLKKFCSVISVRLGPKIIWVNFEKNWTDFEGGVAKTLFSFASKWLTDAMLEMTNETSSESTQPSEQNDIKWHILDNAFKVISFLQESLYLWNTRWRCLHSSGVPPGHCVHDSYPFLCRYVNVQRYCNLWQNSKWRTRVQPILSKLTSSDRHDSRNPYTPSL